MPDQAPTPHARSKRRSVKAGSGEDVFSMSWEGIFCSTWRVESVLPAACFDERSDAAT